MDTNDEHDTVDQEVIAACKPQHCVSIDITKLRNRWWDLVREKRIKDSQQALLERERQTTNEYEVASSSSSSISWDESPVELVSSIQESQRLVTHTDPHVLMSYRESSHPLHRAVMEDNQRFIRELLLHGDSSWIASSVEPRELGITESIHLRAADTFSPLQLAVYLDKPHLIQMLHEDTEVIDSHGRTALMLAAELGLEGCIRALLSCGASLLDKDDLCLDTALHYACRSGCPASTLRVMLSSNSSSGGLMKIVSCKNQKGQTALHMACEHGHVHLVEVFLATCNSSLLSKLLCIQDNRNQTPLMAAVRAESTDVVMSLLMWRGNDQIRKQTGADSSDYNEECLLAGAASVGSIDMVLLLLEFMDPIAKETTYDLDRALNVAVRSTADTRLQIMRVLVEAGARISSSATHEQENASTAVSIACTNGDVEGLTVMLDSLQSHMTAKRTARRKDPKLRRQPESYFEAIEAKENVELKFALANALLQALFLSYMDGDSTSSRLAASMCLFRRGVQLKGADFSILKASIESKRLLSSAEACVEYGGHWYAATYHHFMPADIKHSKGLGAYDRSALQFWSHQLCSQEWMETAADVHCSWMLVRSGVEDDSVKLNKKHLSNQVVLVTETQDFLVDTEIVSRKSAKLAAAIRFESMNQTSRGPARIRLGISAHMCRWLLQHIYHGSIVSDWHPDPLECASDLMECAMIAEEFLCPSLLQECEMRLLSANPFQCYCWSCCLTVRSTKTAAVGDEPIACTQCLYRVQGPSQLLTAECVLDALAVSQQLETMEHTTGCIKWWSPSQLPFQGNISMKRSWDIFNANKCNSAAPFAYVKDAALEVVLRDFCAVVDSYSIPISD